MIFWVNSTNNPGFQVKISLSSLVISVLPEVLSEGFFWFGPIWETVYVFEGSWVVRKCESWNSAGRISIDTLSAVKLHCDRFRATGITSKRTITFRKLMCKNAVTIALPSHYPFSLRACGMCWFANSESPSGMMQWNQIRTTGSRRQ